MLESGRVVDFGFWILDFGLEDRYGSASGTVPAFQSKIQNPKSKIETADG
jgi:hypothetical protein